MSYLYRLAAAFAMATTMTMAGHAVADSWPSGPIKLVVGFPAGGSADRMARLLAGPLQRELGQPVVVENKAGASGILASEYVLGRKDGLTIFLHSTGSVSVRPHTTDLRYDPAKDFLPVTTVAVVPTVFVGSTKQPFRNLQDFINAAKANPGRFNLAVPGAGTTNHLFGALLNKQAGIKTVDIPYAGAAPALQAVMAGDADILNVDIPNVVPLVSSGKIVPYAIAAAQRSPFLPDVPTTAESGYPDLVGQNVWAIYVPADMPTAAVSRLRGALSVALRDPAVRDGFKSGSMAPRESTTDELRKLTASEEALLLPRIKELNLRLSN